MVYNKKNTTTICLIIILLLSYSTGISAFNYRISEQNINIENDTQSNTQIETITIPGKGFHDSLLRISLIFGIYMINPWGEMAGREKLVYDETRENSTLLGPGNLNDVTYSELHKGCEIDIMLPSKKHGIKKIFDITGLKFGLRTRYSNSEVTQYVYASQDNNPGTNTESSDLLMRYNHWEIGPTSDIIFSPPSNIFNIVFHSNILVGYISNGKLNAVSALREAGQIYPKSDYYTKFNGFSLSIGIGPHIVLNRWVPVTFGFTISYTYTHCYFDKKLNLYDRKDCSFNDLSVELSLGTHVF